MNTDKIINCLLCIAATLLIVVLAANAGRLIEAYYVSDDLKRLKDYRETYLVKSGWTKKSGSYQIRSFDKGKNWYASELKDDGSVIIVGGAEQIYPGLLSELAGWDYLSKKAPLNISEGMSQKDIKALEDAGFKVVIPKKQTDQ
jgi:hypothetical protein